MSRFGHFEDNYNAAHRRRHRRKKQRNAVEHCRGDKCGFPRLTKQISIAWPQHQNKKRSPNGESSGSTLIKLYYHDHLYRLLKVELYLVKTLGNIKLAGLGNLQRGIHLLLVAIPLYHFSHGLNGQNMPPPGAHRDIYQPYTGSKRTGIKTSFSRLCGYVIQ